MGIRNTAQVLFGNAADAWIVDIQAPTVNMLVDVVPDPRDAAVDEVAIVFSKPVTGLTIGDLVLTHNGGANLLTGNETLTTTDNLTWMLPAGGPGTLGGFVAFNDHVTGDNTHVNATAYVGNGTACRTL